MKQAIKTWLMLRSRQSKIDHFYTRFKPGMTVLDVGVTSKDDPNEPGPTNFLLKTYRYAPETYTGLGVQDVEGLQKAYPDKRFVRYDGKVFPFADNEFDWVFSNAVIEHVGDEAAQRLFVNEMLRVAHFVFFTTPSKYFPIEAHTHMPFIHWNNRLFDRWLWKYRPKWRSKTSLWLLSAGDVCRLMNESTARDFTVHKNRLLFWPMTLTVVASRLREVSAHAAPPSSDRKAAQAAGSRGDL